MARKAAIEMVSIDVNDVIRQVTLTREEFEREHGAEIQVSAFSGESAVLRFLDKSLTRLRFRQAIKVESCRNAARRFFEPQ